MNPTSRLTLYVPGFGGFHGTSWEGLFPFSRETYADRFAGEEGENGLEAAEFSRILRETSDASRFFTSLAARFCRRYDADISRRLGFELGLAFSEFDLPAGHAGTADFILATMPDKSARKLLALSAAEGHRRLIDSIRERFASYDGLVSYPEDAVREWLAEPVERWGRAELCDLVACFVTPEIDERLYADMAGGSDVRMSFEDSVDWNRFVKAVAACRRERSLRHSTVAAPCSDEAVPAEDRSAKPTA